MTREQWIDTIRTSITPTEGRTRELFTIGYGWLKWEPFVKLLTDAKIEMVVDARIVPWSRSALYRRDELGERLYRAGIEYVHDPGLGNPLRDECKSRKSLDPYREHLARHPEVLDSLLVEVKHGGLRIAVLCGCPRAEQCHRSVIAEGISQRLPGLKVTDLGLRVTK